MIAVVAGLIVAGATTAALWRSHKRVGLGTATASTFPPVLVASVVPVVFLLAGWVLIAAASAATLIGAGPVRRHALMRRDRRVREVAWPEAIEVLALGVGAGMGLNALFEFAGRVGPLPLRQDFRSAGSVLAAGGSRREALRTLGDLAGAPAVATVDVLLAADRDGASMALVLDRLAAEAARAHRLAAEQRARRAPVLMLAPLTLCSLPAVLIGTVVPFIVITFGQTSF